MFEKNGQFKEDGFQASHLFTETGVPAAFPVSEILLSPLNDTDNCLGIRGLPGLREFLGLLGLFGLFELLGLLDLLLGL